MEPNAPQIPNESSEVKVTVTLVLNASFSWSEKPDRNLFTFYIISCVILVSLALAALLLNVLLLLTIVSSSNLKRLGLNKLVCVVSITSFADCLLNVPFSLYLMKVSSIGMKMCTLNSVFVLLISMATTWGVCGMCFERLISTWKRKRSKCAFFAKPCVVIATPLLTAVTIILPLLTGLAEVRVYPNRLSCFIATDKELRYRTFILMCLCCPLCFGLVSLLTSLILNFRNIKSINVQRVDLSYAELFFEESHLWVEWQNTKFVGCIVLLYSAFQIPFIMKEIQYVPTSDKLTQQNATTGLPLVITTPPGDRAYSWIKYSFCLLFPLTTLILRKDIRRKLTSMTSFCRANAAIISKEDSASKVVSPRDSSDDFQIPQGWRRRRLSSVTSLTTPIVFGRPEGSGGKFQMLDISTGISRWKDIYCDSRSSSTLSKKVGKTIFDDTIEDNEEEFTEFVSYEDGTEEEINSSEELQSLTTFKEVAIQTSVTSFGQHSQMNSYFPDISKAMEKRHRKPCRSISKSFTEHRTDRSVPRSKNYLTYPKLSPNARYLMQLRCNPSTSDLMKALKAYRSHKYTAACDIIPRGTGELMDTSLGEGRQIVSL